MPASYTPPSSDTEHEDITASLMPTTKRRASGFANNTNVNNNNNSNGATNGDANAANKAVSSNLPPLPPIVRSFVVGRRKRLFMYLSAFAIMLALSSMLDLRRAALDAKKNNSRIKLSLPASNNIPIEDTSISGPVDAAAISASITNRTAAEIHIHHPASSHPVPHVAQPPPAESHHILHDDSSFLHDPDHETSATAKKQKLSAQEMEDGVQELISHVEAETSANNSVAHDANSTEILPGSGTNSASLHHHHAAGISSHDASAGGGTFLHPAPGTGKSSHEVTPGPAANATATTTTTMSTVEEQFSAAQTLLESITANKTLKPLVDAEELRTLQALALQGTRGDCEKANDPNAGGGLFKTDIEANSADIEKTDPLWGAWCVFSGRLRTECMRDYVARIHSLHARISAAAAAAENNNNTDSNSAPAAGIGIGTADGESFDESAATLDDVLTPEAQNILKKRAEKLVPHLSENDVRLLSALSLQASLGDCGPYAAAMKLRKKLEEQLKKEDDDSDNDGDNNNNKTMKNKLKKHALLKHPPRSLEEGIFGNKIGTRGEGALWGAWCVFARRKRATAAASLTDRIDGFWSQLIVQTTVHNTQEEEENGAGEEYGNNNNNNIENRLVASRVENNEISNNDNKVR